MFARNLKILIPTQSKYVLYKERAKTTSKIPAKTLNILNQSGKRDEEVIPRYTQLPILSPPLLQSMYMGNTHGARTYCRREVVLITKCSQPVVLFFDFLFRPHACHNIQIHIKHPPAHIILLIAGDLRITRRQRFCS